MMLRRLPGVALSLAAGAVAGLISAVAAIESFGWAQAAPGSLWTSRDTAADAAAYPYAIAHYLLQGRLPASTNQTHEFAADRDADGNRIHAECVYEIAGTPDTLHWWSIAAGSGGRGPAPYSSFLTASDAVRNADGTLTIALSRQPLPGNWIRPPSLGRVSMIYTVAGFATADEAAAIPPFTIKRIRC